MAAVVGNAGSMTPSFRPAGELRGVLGWLNKGQRQQGCDAQAVKESPSIEGLFLLVANHRYVTQRFSQAINV